MSTWISKGAALLALFASDHVATKANAATKVKFPNLLVGPDDEEAG